MDKIPIGIKSCERNSERQNACRNTWVGSLDKDKYFPLFLIGRKNQPSEIIGDILYLDCEDHYQGLSGKIKEYYKWALSNTKATHFWSCDDDSYINYNTFNTFEEYKNSKNSFLCLNIVFYLKYANRNIKILLCSLKQYK